MQSLLPEVYDFHPRPFILPHQYHDLRIYMQFRKCVLTFIIKPDAGCQGKG
jgi:hypothetical protein